MFGLLSSVFGLLLYWGLISLLVTTRRDGILLNANDVMGSISNSLYFFFFFWLRIHGLAVSKLPVMGLPWMGLVLLYMYFFFFFFRF